MPTLAKALCDKLGFIALKSSYVLWLNRDNKDFKSWRLSVPNISLTKADHIPVPKKEKLSRLKATLGDEKQGAVYVES